MSGVDCNINILFGLIKPMKIFSINLSKRNEITQFFFYQFPVKFLGRLQPGSIGLPTPATGSNLSLIGPS